MKATSKFWLIAEVKTVCFRSSQLDFVEELRHHNYLQRNWGAEGLAGPVPLTREGGNVDIFVVARQKPTGP